MLELVGRLLVCARARHIYDGLHPPRRYPKLGLGVVDGYQWVDLQAGQICELDVFAKKREISMRRDPSVKASMKNFFLYWFGSL